MSSVDDPEYHIILALQKMGIYMERDKTALAALSAKDQATRLQSAFDKAVETCCILPLLFNKKELRPDKLKLSHRKKWTGWDESRRATYLSDTDRFRGSVKAIGDHSLWGPFRIARYSVEASAKIQGASVRWGDDVKVLETLIMRFCLTPALYIDISGRAAGLNGCYWALTDIPANNNGDTMRLPLPPQSSAVFALQSLDVIEVELDCDIDTREAEKSVKEPEFQMHGYNGNANRRAMPVIVVRYASSLPGFGTKDDVASLVSHARMKRPDAGSSYITKTHLSMFTRLLASNARLLPPGEQNHYKRDLPARLRAKTTVSFISPIFCPSSAVADRIEVGGKHLLTCALCGKEQDALAGVKLSYCSSCCGTTYCSPEHQKQDWNVKHKSECKLSNKRRTVNKNTPSKILITLARGVTPLPSTSSEKSYCIYINPIDRIKPEGTRSSNARCPKTIYGSDERFLLRARWAGHVESIFGVPESARQSDTSKTLESTQDAMLHMMMNVIHFVDRAQSVGPLLQRQTGMVGAGTMILPAGLDMEGMAEDNSEVFDRIVNIIRKHSAPRDKTQVFYFWAVRRGDCLEIDLEDLPDQRLGW